jgi:hypothetical protein
MKLIFLLYEDIEVTMDGGREVGIRCQMSGISAAYGLWGDQAD